MTHETHDSGQTKCTTCCLRVHLFEIFYHSSNLTLLLDLTSGGEFSSADQQLFENGDSSFFLLCRNFRQAMDFAITFLPEFDESYLKF